MLLSSLNILVAGAATGGASTALLLARSGARITIVDRIQSPSAIGAGLALAANGRAVLEALGLGPALGCATELSATRIIDGRGRTLAEAPPDARFAVVTRARLQEVLVDALFAEPNITCRFGTSVMRASTDGSVVLRGPDGETREQFDLIVGADGVHSQVRDGGAFGARLTRTGVRYLRALVPVHVSDATEAWTAAGVFGALPLDGGTYIFASCASPALSRAIEQRDLRALREAWGNAYAPAERLLGAVPTFGDLLIHEVIRVDCTRWYDQRLVLVGDAAHAMAPNLGQGANSALVDAAVLLDALRSSRDLATALAAYDARRRDKVRTVANTSARLGQLAEITHPLARTLRDRMLVPLLKLLPQDRQLRTLLQESPATLLRIARQDHATSSAVSH